MAKCAACEKSLTLRIQNEDLDEDENKGASSLAEANFQLVPDDLQLSCGDHFHW
jgi:hypothetical protein